MHVTLFDVQRMHRHALTSVQITRSSTGKWHKHEFDFHVCPETQGNNLRVLSGTTNVQRNKWPKGGFNGLHFSLKECDFKLVPLLRRFSSLASLIGAHMCMRTPSTFPTHGIKTGFFVMLCSWACVLYFPLLSPLFPHFDLAARPSLSTPFPPVLFPS